MSLPNLPDEVIFQILQLLDDGEIRPSDHEYGTRKAPSPFLSLSSVCHRLSTLAESFLYSHLRLVVSVKDQEKARDLSYRTTFDNICSSLRQKTYRYSFIRSLDLDVRLFSPSYDQTHRDLLDLLERCPEGISISLKCNRHLFSDLDLCETLKTKRIKNMEAEDVTIEALTEPGSFEQLQSLSLNSVSSISTQRRKRHWWKNYELPTDRRGESLVKDLQARFDICHPCTISPVLYWIANLKSLKLTFSYTPKWTGEFSTDDLQRMLDVHSSTLEVITLGEYSGSLANFKHFSNLKELCIGRAQFFSAGPYFTASQLATPHLHNLIVDFQIPLPRLRNYGQFYSETVQKIIKEYRSRVAVDGIRQIRLINLDFKSDEGDEHWLAMRAGFDGIEISLQLQDDVEVALT